MPFQVIPRELVFYDLLDAAAKNVAEGAGELAGAGRRSVPTDGAARTDPALESTGDDITHQIISTLNQTFVVPIDRHDILHLASALDDVIDCQEGIADLIELLPLTELFPAFPHAGRGPHGAAAARSCERSAICRSCRRSRPTSPRSSGRSARGTSSTGGRSPTCTRVTTDPLEVLMWKDLLHQVEAAIDRCEDVANQIESVVAKFR